MDFQEKVNVAKPPRIFADLKEGDLFRTKRGVTVGPFMLKVEHNSTTMNAANIVFGTLLFIAEDEEVMKYDGVMYYEEIP